VHRAANCSAPTLALLDFRAWAALRSAPASPAPRAARSYLKRFPIDEIKIDRSFVAGVHGDKDDAAIVTAIIAMAHSFRLRVVAVGVESALELDFLLQ
jgi:hypothetical protein